MNKEQTHSILKDALLGALGGIAGTMAMGKLSSFLYKFESEEKKHKEETLRKQPPYQTMAEKMARNILNKELTDQQKKKAGMALHWAYGIGWGALYGVLRKRVPMLSKAAGLPFATAFTLIGDEGMNTAFGVTPPPREFPWEAHARGYAGHIAFTATLEAVSRVGDKIAA